MSYGASFAEPFRQVRIYTDRIRSCSPRKPGMTGLELLPKAKAARPDVPVIMITAYGDAETRRKALEGGAEALFTKPIDFGMLRGEIDTRVERAA
jgi:DNA-binding NtrC family response regulator